MAIVGRQVARRSTRTGSRADGDCAVDEALMVRVAAGEEAALGALYDRFIHRVHSLARHMCGHEAAAQDVVQDVFLEVWRRAAQFDPDRGSVSIWLVSLTHRTAVDAIRRTSLRRQTGLDDDGEISPGPGTDQVATDALVAGRVRGALAQLPPPVRQALALTCYGGYTQTEVAAILGISLSAVKEHISGATARLREQLQQLRETV